MKKLLLLAVLFTCVSASAQNFMVIDASKKTKAIFDYDNPQSYVNVLLWNYNYIPYFNNYYMNENSLSELNNKQRSELFPYVENREEYRMYDEDSESPNFGEYLIEIDPETGLESYTYYPQDTSFIDLKGITRIIIEYKEGAGPLFERVESVIFCKIYNTAYVPVLEFYGNSILNLDGFHFSNAISEDQLLELTKTDSESYWSQIRNAVRNKKGLNTGYAIFPTEDFFLGSIEYRHAPNKVKKVDEFLDLKYSSYDDSDRYPFDFWYRESLTENYKFLDTIINDFDSVEYVLTQSDIPLIDEDWNSETFGEGLITYDSLGYWHYVYPDPEVLFGWVEFTPDGAYAVSSIVDDGSGFYVELEQLMFTKQIDGVEHIVFSQTVDVDWGNLVGKEIIHEREWESWNEEFMSTLEKGKKTDGSKLKNRAKMNMIDSFWYRYYDGDY
jgi:hypothetical protein